MKRLQSRAVLRSWPGIFALAIAISQLCGQSDQESKAFEVASVKLLPEPGPGTSTGGGPGTSDPGRWWRLNVTMGSLLAQAFHIQGRAFVGPDWLRSTRYDITATVPSGAHREDVPAMIQTLLKERFGLKFHREQKEMPAYALVTARNGPKLKPSADSPASIAGRDGFSDLPEGVAPGVMKIDSVGSMRRLAAGAMSMAQFADYLAGQNDLLVLDLTGLPGKYDIVFYYSRPDPLSGNDLRTDLRDQLGLELQARKTQVDLLVIDHIEQTPSAN